MLFVWILIAIVGLFFLFILLRYPYLILKRQSLVRKMKKNADEMILCRNRFRSIFKKDGNPDLIVQKGKQRFSVFILSTPFRKLRYHFENNERLVLFWDRRGIRVSQPVRLYRVSVYQYPITSSDAFSLDHSFKIKQYVFSFCPEPGTIPFVIPHPAPKLMTRTSGPKSEVLLNNDELFDGIRISGLRYFLSNVLSEGADE